MPTQYMIPPGADEPSKLPNVEREQDYMGILNPTDNPRPEFRRHYDFELPDGIHVNQNRRIVIAFMLDPTDGANMPYSVRLNGAQVVAGHPIGGTKRGVWEVTSGDRLRSAPEMNTLEIWTVPDGDSRGFLRFSDIVIWFTST